MKVKELIEILSKYEPEKEVKIFSYEIEDTHGGWWEKEDITEVESEDDYIIIS